MKRNDWSELLQTLEELHEAAPDFRFGQLVCNAAMHTEPPDETTVWDIEDSDLLAAAKSLLEQLRNSLATHAETV